MFGKLVGVLLASWLGLVFAQDYMTTDMTPDPGPEMDTVYQPGTPGAQWSAEEVDTTRQRIIQMISPEWDVKVCIRLNLSNPKVNFNMLFNDHLCIQACNGYRR